MPLANDVPLVCPNSVNIYAWLKLPHIIQQLCARATRKTVVTLSNLPEAVAFLRVAEQDLRIGDAVRQLTIDIRPWNLVAYEARISYCPTMRGILRLVPKVTDLTLMLPKCTPPDIFFQVFFPDLQVFKTNLPHAKIKHLVTLHTSLAILVLGPCGQEGRCALADASLERVTTIECSAGCLQAVARPRLVHLSAENDSTAVCVPVIFRQLRAGLSDLYSLTLDIFAADLDILVSIALVAPRVRKLKLLEQPIQVGRRISSRRAFNDHVTWHRCLRGLPFLEEFALRTFAPLVRTCGDYALERRMIIGWVYGARLRGAKSLHPSKSHPSLYHIRVWYGRTLQSATLSKWFKDAGQWVRLGDPLTGAHLAGIDF